MEIIHRVASSLFTLQVLSPYHMRITSTLFQFYFVTVACSIQVWSFLTNQTVDGKMIWTIKCNCFVCAPIGSDQCPHSILTVVKFTRLS